MMGLAGMRHTKKAFSIPLNLSLSGLQLPTLQSLRLTLNVMLQDYHGLDCPPQP